MNNIYNRYIWLLHTVYQERKVTFERLCDIWKHHFLYNGKPLSLRTFHHHRKMIEENFDIVIACNRKDYTYYIQNLNEILGDNCRNWLFNSRIIDVALKSSPCLFHRVVLPDMSGSTTRWNRHGLLFRATSMIRLLNSQLRQLSPSISSRFWI